MFSVEANIYFKNKLATRIINAFQSQYQYSSGTKIGLCDDCVNLRAKIKILVFKSPKALTKADKFQPIVRWRSISDNIAHLRNYTKANYT